MKKYIASSSKTENGVQNVTEGIEKTKREVIALKEELDKLRESRLKTQFRDENKENSSNRLLPIVIKQQIKSPQNLNHKVQDQQASNKPKNYNVEATRTYIAKQKEKRAAEQKKSTTQNETELRKEKLRDLNKKTRELVVRNVQLKRERSKSNNRNEINKVDSSRVRSKSTTPGGSVAILSSGNGFNDAEELSEKAKISKREGRPRERTVATPTDLKSIDSSKTNIQTNKEQILIPSKSKSEDIQKNNEQILISPKINNNLLISEKLNNNKITKETQTEVKKQTENWLQVKTSVPYPYNFINSVKRKLHNVVYSPKIDIGTQSSLVEGTKSISEIKQLLIDSTKSSKIRSKVLTKTPILDLAKVDKLELKSSNKLSKLSKNLFTNYTSEQSSDTSDTSKNIPDISSEFISANSSSTKSNLKSNSEMSLHKLSLDKLNSFKLEPIQISSPVQKSTTYVSDFTNEEEILSEKTSCIHDSITKRSTSNDDKQLSFHSLISKDTSSSKTELPNTITKRKKSNIIQLDEPNARLQLVQTSNQCNSSNKIHLKFDAEVRLLNDFNNSLQHFTTVEKAFEDLKNKNQQQTNQSIRIYQNVDTQTSLLTQLTKASRSEQLEQINESNLNETFFNLTQSSTISTLCELNNWQNSKNESNTVTDEPDETVLSITLEKMVDSKQNEPLGFAVKMLDQFIQDEDARRAQLTTIIKMREQALLDRARKRLEQLELQRKQLIESGKIEKASLIKKRQRCILVKAEEERNVIKKLQQLQKQTSNDHKVILKREKQQLIKNQLSTATMLSKASKTNDRSYNRERRNSGPLKVLQNSSETSDFCDGDNDIQSKQSICELFNNKLDNKQIPVSTFKRTLLLRESELKKRRQAVEDLLKWHQKLIDEEKKITELEVAATKAFEPKTSSEKVPTIVVSNNENTSCKEVNKSIESGGETSEIEQYSYVFESDGLKSSTITNTQTIEEKSSIPTQSLVLNNLISNFTQIELGIEALSKETELNLSKLQNEKPDNIVSMTPKDAVICNKSESDQEQSNTVKTDISDEKEDILTVSNETANFDEADESNVEEIIDSETVEISVKSNETTNQLLALDEALVAATNIEESLTKLNDTLADQIAPDLNLTVIIKSKDDSDSNTSSEQIETISELPKQNIDVKKRLAEILDSSNNLNKSPRIQDLYVTTYDVETNENAKPPSVLGNEAEELWKKQLAIEQEIKQLEQQQQVSYAYMREIPNKPPPPYTPPAAFTPISQSVLPTDLKEINEMTNYCSKVIFKAYQTANLNKCKYSENSFKLCSKIKLNRTCGELMFNICRDLAREHFTNFEICEEEPIWLRLDEFGTKLLKRKPFDVNGLERFMNRKLKEIFGFVNVDVSESANIKWGRKKRDHVDEVLVKELLAEESQWNNFDQDDLFIKEQVTNDIMKLLLDDTIFVFSKIINNKISL